MINKIKITKLNESENKNLFNFKESCKKNTIHIKEIYTSKKNNITKYEIKLNKIIKINVVLNEDEKKLFKKYEQLENNNLLMSVNKVILLDDNTNIDNAVISVKKLFDDSVEIVNNEFKKYLKELINLDYLITSSFDDKLIKIRQDEFKEMFNEVITLLCKPSKQKNENRVNIKINNFKKGITNLIKINSLEEKLQFSNYQNTFITARSMDRKIKVFVGPTNSGKTYSAFEVLKKVDKGSYLAPLRLLAHEGADKLFERGVISDILTGEERKTIPGATHICSTIEMAQLDKTFDCVVIDEIQMLLDPQRGWAWTQALVGMKTKELILVGSPEILPILVPLLDELKENYEITNFERKNELKISNSLNGDVSKIETGDCLVVFSRKAALYYKSELNKLGKKCSVIYGNLSPELRVAEARKFNSGNTDILIATDAIGMGLNLPIKRIYFSKVEKYNGISNELVEPSLIKQIAGRAGRYGFDNDYGYVSTLFNEDLNYLKTCLKSGYQKIEDKRCYIQPSMFHIEEICNSLNCESVSNALIFFKEKMVNNSDYYKPSNLNEMIKLAHIIESQNLSLRDTYLYATAPIDTKNDDMIYTFMNWLKLFKEGNDIKCPRTPNEILSERMDDDSLFVAENYIKKLNVYRWLNNHYEQYNNINQVNKNSKIVIDYIEKTLNNNNNEKNIVKKRRNKYK